MKLADKQYIKRQNNTCVQSCYLVDSSVQILDNCLHSFSVTSDVGYFYNCTAKNTFNYYPYLKRIDGETMNVGFCKTHKWLDLFDVQPPLHFS